MHASMCAEGTRSQPGPKKGAADAEELFRRAAEALPGGILVVGATGILVWVNQQLARQFGYTCEELIGRHVDSVLPGALRVMGAMQDESAGVRPEARTMGVRRLWQGPGLRRDGTEIPVEIGVTPLETENGVFVVSCVIDITQRVRFETGGLKLERLMAELSFKFINLPPDQVLHAIGDALRRIGEALDVDRCSFYRVQPDGELLAPFGWWREGISPQPVVTSARERFPWAVETIFAGRLLSFSTIGEIPNPVDRVGYQAYGIQSSVTVPLSVAGRIVGAVGFNMLRRERKWDPDTVHSMRAIAAVFGNVLARLKGDDALRHVISEAERIRDQLESENMYLRREFSEWLGAGNIIGQSAAIRRVLEQIRQVAATDSTVLLLGETGTGKELLATYLHELSARRGRAMVRVSCAAIPDTLVESELFGREKGAFTGALARQVGRFELADRSTIFLDEIGDLPPNVQVKLLRVLEQQEIERLGSSRTIRVDVRIIAATHQDLEQQIAQEKFREDLFYRLNVFPIHVPPLRDRVDDIPLLVWRFVDEFSKAFGKRIDAIPRENVAALQQYSWPGNIRELRNVVERAMIGAIGTRLTIAVPRPSLSIEKSHVTLADVAKEHILNVLESTGWHIRGSEGAAERLGLKPTTLETRMAKLGLTRPKGAGRHASSRTDGDCGAGPPESSRAVR
jgi:formate hydrogenlyase transcriptional activator